jgi:hypothetical protein
VVPVLGREVVERQQRVAGKRRVDVVRAVPAPDYATEPRSMAAR